MCRLWRWTVKWWASVPMEPAASSPGGLHPRVERFVLYTWHPMIEAYQTCMLAVCTGKGNNVQVAIFACHPRVCIVNNHGAVLMDKFARPKERVTDFRTRFSGIRCFLLP